MKKKQYIALVAILMMAILPALSGAAQAGAVEYKSTYRGVQSTEYRVQTVGVPNSTTPAVGFQSTSAYSSQWGKESSSSLLNSDGSVNSSAYMSSGPHYAKKDGVGDPSGGIDPPDDDDDDNTENGTPLGEGILALLMMALAYLGCRKYATIVKREGEVVANMRQK